MKLVDMGSGYAPAARPQRYRGRMEIAGLPLHPLVVHAAVVLTPLAAALVVVFAVLPRHRWLTRWPAVATTVVALGSVWVSRFSGNSLADSLPGIEQVIETHRSRGVWLSLAMVVFTLLVAVSAWALGGPSALASGRGARESRVAGQETLLVVLLVASALVVLVLVGLTGDAGARAVWG